MIVVVQNKNIWGLQCAHIKKVNNNLCKYALWHAIQDSSSGEALCMRTARYSLAGSFINQRAMHFSLLAPPQ